MKRACILMASLLVMVTLNAAAAGQKQADQSGKIAVGFANIAETAEQHIVIRDGMEKAATDAGYQLIYMNNRLDGQVAVSNADVMLQRGIKAFIEFNVDQSVAPTIMDMMNAAKVPVVAVDIGHPGAVYFGANNYGVGPIVGEYLGNVVKKEWGGEPDCLFIMEDPISGETVLARTDNIPEGFRKVFPNFPDSKIFKLDGGQDPTKAQEVAANFLSAHPNFTKIAVAPAHSTYMIGGLAAIETAGRQRHCIMIGQGEYHYLEYLKNNPQPPAWEVYRGTLVYNFKEYGSTIMPIVTKLLNNQPVEKEYYPRHYIIDRTNARQEFPEYFK
jgi:ribose transport system substrate-binding protein